MNRRVFFNQPLWLLLLFVLSLTALAQQPVEKGIQVTPISSQAIFSLRLNSKLMGRDMPYRVVLPVNYSDPKAVNERYPVIYLLHGYGGHFDNWTDKTGLKQYAANFKSIIVMPEGENGFYTDSAKNVNNKYESYIIQELIPEIDKNYRTLAERRYRAVGGLSMGGYGAMKFGLKYPQMFVLAGSFSGAIAASSYSSDKELPPGNLGKTLFEIFDAPESEVHQANDLFKILSEMPSEKAAALPFLYLDCGTEDALGLLPINRMFADILVKRKIPHEYRQLPGGHNWIYWDAQVQEFLRLSERFFRQSVKAKTN